MSARVLIAAGGTGGHVFPGLAVAEWLHERGARVDWLGTARGIEQRLVPARGIKLHTLEVRGVRRMGWRRALALPLTLARAVADARRILRALKPDVVLGMGGYVAGPAGLAARLCGTPLVVHEQNARPGLTNRVLSRVASRLLEAFDGSFAPARGARYVGNPVRADIAALPEPAARLAARSGALRVLVLGGSQGAQALNEVVPVAFGLTAPGQVEVWHQCGVGRADEVRQAYSDAGSAPSRSDFSRDDERSSPSDRRGAARRIAMPTASHGTAASAQASAGGEVNPSVRVAEFLDDMVAAYSWADLVVCRAGAMTVAEIAAVGVGALFVPYPFAVDDHQTHNANWLARRGAGEVIPQSSLDAASLALRFQRLAEDREALFAMAAAARAAALPTAAEAVGLACLELAGARHG